MREPLGKIGFIVALAFLGSAQSTAPLIPDDQLTPGMTGVDSKDVICTPNYTRRVRQVSTAMRRSIFVEYGMTAASCGHCEIDHRVPLEIGGSNGRENLWPQSYDTKPWNALVKDQLENEIHRQVCEGDISLEEAQELFRGNWIDGYKRAFKVNLPS